MNKLTKQNDFIVALVENPTFELKDFKEVGLSADNTGLQDRDTYRNSKFIQDKFMNGDTFDEVSFNKFYDSAASTYQLFANNLFESEILDDAEFDPYNALRPEEGKTKQPSMDMVQVFNPNRLKTGISRVGRTDAPEWSVAELALKNRVFDYATLTWKDYTPNDNVLFGNLGGWLTSLTEPLVIALWEEEGYHEDPITGRRIKHVAGDYKYDENGDYYYETLGGREVYNKQVKSIFDSFTVDGSKANKYDFFDSDSLDKSVAGTIMKTATTIAPLFIPGVNAYYGAALVGANLFDILPGIYKTTFGLYQDTPVANLLQGMGRSFKLNKSVYSQENLISTENFFDLVTDVALQWALLRAIFEGYHKLTGTSKIQSKALKEAQEMALRNPATLTNPESAVEMSSVYAANKLKPLLEKRNRTAANAALGYMAMLSGLDSFESALAQGADRTEAAVVAWGTIAGLYGITRTGLGEIFFPELKGDAASLQKSLLSVGDEITKGLNITAKTVTEETKKKGLAKLFNATKEKSSQFWKDVRGHSLGFFGKAMGEGIEEVSEELVSDFIKLTFNWASEFGYTKTDTKLDAWKDMRERYGMAFFGGAVGGAIFAGVDLAQNRKNSEQLNQELIYAIRNNKTGELLELLEVLRNKNKLGNKNLSATKSSIDADGNINWTSPTSKDDNQNEATYRIIKNYILSLDAVINQEGLKVSDNELLDRMIMGDIRMKSLLNFGKLEGEKFGPLIANGYVGLMLNDWNTLASDILKIDGDILQLQKGVINGTKVYSTDSAISEAKKDPESQYSKTYLDLINKKNVKLEERDKFLNGTYSQYYTDLMLFAIDNNVNKYFFTPTFKDWVEFKTKKSYDSLSINERLALITDYEAFKQGAAKDNLKEAFELYKELNLKSTEKVGLNGESYELFALLRNLIKDTLINKDATDYKLESIKTNNIEEIESRFKEFSLSINPEINEDYTLFEFKNNPNLSLEENENLKQFILNHNISVLNNISNLILQIKLIGFIDSKTKNLIKSLLKAPTALDLYSIAVNETTLPDLSAFPELLAEINNILSDLTFDNINEISEKFNRENIRKLKGIDDWAEATSAESAAFDYMSEDEEMDFLSDNFRQALKIINQKAEENETIRLTLNLDKELSEIKENPIFDLLSTFSVNMYGNNINIFLLLEEENLRFGSVASVAEYVLDSNKISEIEQGLNVLNMTEAIIKAASTSQFNAFEPYGHNLTMNYFLENYFPNEKLYSIIRSDLALMMLEDIDSIREQLLFLYELSNLNAANLFIEHKKTGRVMAKLLGNILKGRDQYAFLKDITYKDKKLFLDIDTPAIDSDSDSDAIFKEFDSICDNYYDRIQQISKETGDSITVVLSHILKQVVQKMDTNSILLLKNSELNSRTKALEDYDVLVWLAAIMSLKRSDFNYYLKDIITDENTKFAPLFAQEYTAEVALSLIANPDISEILMSLYPTGEGVPGSELLRLYQTIIMNGIGGAGKTSVVALIVYRIAKKWFPNLNIYKVGPDLSLVDNLNIALGSEGENLTIDMLMERILGKSAFGELKNDIESEITDSKYYTVNNVKLTDGSEGPIANIKSDIEFSDVVNKPKIIFLDEATHVNSVYLQFLTKWAYENKIILVLMGDLIQNGYSNLKLGMFNIEPDSSIAIRTPKLNISLRITNRLKKDNIDALLAIINAIDINGIANQIKSMGPDEAKAYISELARKCKDLISKFLVLKYYLDKDNPLNGEMISLSINENFIDQLLLSGEELGYVYDNQNSPTYKLIQDYIKSHPDAESKITFYTPLKVQGSEKKYFIIDLDYSKIDLNNSPVAAYDFMRNLYTMTTRSKNGTVLIDNGLSLLISKENNIKEEHTSLTADPTLIIKDFKEHSINILETNLLGYTPHFTGLELEEPLEETTTDSLDENPEPSNDSSEPSSNPEPLTDNSLNTPTSGTSDTTPPGTVLPRVDDPELITPSTEVLQKATPEDNNYNADFDNSIFNQNDEIPDQIVDTVDTLSGIRVYGWYLRYGVELFEEDGLTKYKRIDREDGIVDDLNMFLSKNKEYEELEIQKGKNVLIAIRDYIDSGTPFDEDFLKILENNKLTGFKFGLSDEEALNLWNSGKFKLEVRPLDKNIDKPIDKQGYDVSKVEAVAFNLVYQINHNNKIYQITIGKLSNPSTWKTYLTETKELNLAILKSLADYEKWYNDLTKQIKASGETKRYDIPDNGFKPAKHTRFTAVLEGGQVKRFNLEDFERDHPNAMRSSVYIYSGLRGLFLGKLSDSLKGKAIMFTAARKHLKINGEVVKPELLAAKYIEQNQTAGSSPNIRIMVLDPKGLYIFSDETHEGFFDLSFRDLNSDESKDVKKAVKQRLATYGSNTTAARIITALWNYRAGLAQVEEIMDRNPGATTDAINHLINKNYKKHQFKVVPDTLELTRNGKKAYGMGVVNENDMWKVSITQNQVKALKYLLDHLIKLLSNVVVLPEESKAKYAISLNETTKGYIDWKNLLDSLTSNNAELIFKSKTGTYRHKAFSKNGSFKVVSILSAFSKLFSQHWTAANFNITTTDINLKPININLSHTLMLATEASRIANVENPGTFVRNTLNMILHGKLNPYRSDISTHRTYAPFPNGILYHARYTKHSSEDSVSDFYPVVNVDNQFTYNRTIEWGNAEISFNPRELKEELPDTSSNFKMRELFMSELENIANLCFSLGYAEEDIVPILHEAEQKYNKEGDISINTTMLVVSNTLNTKLAEDSNKGKLFVNNDRIISAKITIDKNNKSVITKTTLLDKLINNSTIKGEITTDGKLDFSKIQEISYSGSLNENFDITLSNGNKFAGKINKNKSVSIQDRSIYTIGISNDQKFIFETFLNAFNGVLTIIPSRNGKLLTTTEIPIDNLKLAILHILSIAPNQDINSKEKMLNYIQEIINYLKETKLMLDENLEPVVKIFLNLNKAIKTSENLICKI